VLGLLHRDHEDGSVDLIVKCVTLGDYAVGKTSLLRRYASGDRGGCGAVPEATVGVDFVHATERVAMTERGEHRVKLHVWDTAGHERFRTILPLYLRNVYVYLVVGDITDRLFGDSVKRWKRVVDAEVARHQRTTAAAAPPERLPLVFLLANKVDLVTTSAAAAAAADAATATSDATPDTASPAARAKIDDVKRLARALRFDGYYLTSALHEVAPVFRDIAVQVVRRTDALMPLLRRCERHRPSLGLCRADRRHEARDACCAQWTWW
jgi:small GTP-binding protein